MRIDLNGLTILLISGTASIDENGVSVHIGDFRAQMKRTFSNITGLLEAEGCTWHDIVRTTCYLRDIERDYEAFNEERTAFYAEQELDPLPASLVSRPFSAGPSCLLKSKPSPCSAQRRPVNRERGTCEREGLVMRRLLLIPACLWAVSGVLSGAAQTTASGATQPAHVCECGAHPPGPPRDRMVVPYAGEPADMVPYSKFAAPTTPTTRAPISMSARHAIFPSPRA